jgi:dihydrofolate reductase
MPDIHILVAMTQEGVIGSQGQLPWMLPEDLQLFRQLTVGKTVLMGRITYQSIGQPLAHRHNIVISKTLPKTKGIEICSSFSEGIHLAQSFSQDIFCIGGVKIYQQALAIAKKLDVSWVENNASGDCFFPEFDLNEWDETERRVFSGFVHCSYVRKDRL